MIDIEASHLRAIERSEARAYRVQCGGASNAIFDVVEDQALDGLAVKFETPFRYKGDWIMLRAGCFGNPVRGRVGMWIDHLESSEVASTDDALELMVDDEGLQFRLDLGKCKMGPIVARMANSDSRSSMSVHSDILNEHRETIDGKRVRVVTRARLKEISACREGAAGDNAFAFVVDKTITPKPVAGSRSATMQAAQLLHRVSSKVRKLKAQALATYGDSKPTQRTTMTLAQINRMQTAEVERLQEQARLRLF